MKGKNVTFFLIVFYLITLVGNVECLQTSGTLSLTQARQYMLELINRDRVSHGLNPVTMDPVATDAGQKHAEGMAKYCYLAHWDREGELPQQRYDKAGGAGFDEENAYSVINYYGCEPKGPMRLEKNPTFTRKDIEDIESSYMNETPPDDGHRENILDPYHTQVGIALAKSKTLSARMIVNTQEFVNNEAWLGEKAADGDVTLFGVVTEDYKFIAITVGRDALPTPMSVKDLCATGSYGMPTPFAVYPSYGCAAPSHAVFETSSGVFHITVKSSDFEEPGLYYVSVWLRSNGQDFIGTQKTIVVKGDEIDTNG